jgi:hypothetical protein
MPLFAQPKSGMPLGLKLSNTYIIQNLALVLILTSALLFWVAYGRNALEKNRLCP